MNILREPILIGTAIEGIILAVVAFGMDWSGEQVAAIMFAVMAVLALIERALVTPLSDPRGIDGLP